MSWHVDTTLLRQYRTQELSDARMASVEMHVTTCPACRALVAAEVDPSTAATAERVKLALDDKLDGARLGWLSHSLQRVGVTERDAGLLTATLSLHGSLVAASALAMVFCVLAALSGPEGAGLAAFLVVAPIVPLGGVAMAYGSRVDPTHEIALAASVPAARIILLRVLAVTVPALPIMVVLSFFLPGGLLAFAWLLPALGLAAASLALGTFMPLHRAALWLGAGWVIGAAAALADAPRKTADAFVHGFIAFRPSGQLLFAAMAAASLLLAAQRRAAFESAR